MLRTVPREHFLPRQKCGVRFPTVYVKFFVLTERMRILGFRYKMLRNKDLDNSLETLLIISDSEDWIGSVMHFPSRNRYRGWRTGRQRIGWQWRFGWRMERSQSRPMTFYTYLKMTSALMRMFYSTKVRSIFTNCLKWGRMGAYSARDEQIQTVQTIIRTGWTQTFRTWISSFDCAWKSIISRLLDC